MIEPERQSSLASIRDEQPQPSSNKSLTKKIRAGKNVTIFLTALSSVMGSLNVAPALSIGGAVAMGSIALWLQHLENNENDRKDHDAFKDNLKTQVTLQQRQKALLDQFERALRPLQDCTFFMSLEVDLTHVQLTALKARLDATPLDPKMPYIFYDEAKSGKSHWPELKPLIDRLDNLSLGLLCYRLAEASIETIKEPHINAACQMYGQVSERERPEDSRARRNFDHQFRRHEDKLIVNCWTGPVNYHHTRYDFVSLADVFESIIVVNLTPHHTVYDGIRFTPVRVILESKKGYRLFMTRFEPGKEQWTQYITFPVTQGQDGRSMRFDGKDIVEATDANSSVLLSADMPFEVP